MRTLLIALAVLGVVTAVPTLAAAEWAPCNGEPPLEAYWCWWGPGAQQVHVCGTYVGDFCVDIW